jgi:hypothetical protein
MAYTKEAAQQYNASFMEALADPSGMKTAAEGVTLWTRERVREDGFWRKVLVPRTVTASELTRAVHTDKPLMIFDKEPTQPPAATVPYGQAYMDWYILAPKYELSFARITSPRFVKDLSELRTYQIDVRQIMADNAVKDMLYEEDTQAISAVNTILGGSVGAQAPMTGIVQWVQESGGITRDTWIEARSVMGSMYYSVEPKLFVVNNTSVQQFRKWDRIEMGGDMSEKIFTSGFATGRWGDLDFIVTIKKDLVPNNVMYFFGDPQFMGHFCVLEEPTMWVKREMHSLEFQLTEEVGCVISHAAAITAATFV